MSNLINPKPRFGFNPDTGMIYDYIAQKDVSPVAVYEASDGQWNLLEVKRAILATQTIEFARLSVKKPAPAAAKAPTPAAAPAAGKPAGGDAAPAKAPAPGHGVTALSAQQLQALKLSALQMAAMGITPVQMNVTGATALQVANWGLNAARANALQLTAEQRVGLQVPA